MKMSSINPSGMSASAIDRGGRGMACCWLRSALAENFPTYSPWLGGEGGNGDCSCDDDGDGRGGVGDGGSGDGDGRVGGAGTCHPSGPLLTRSTTVLAI